MPWTVHPHDPIERIDDTVWRVEGTLPKSPLRRVMTVIRRSDGTLVLHSVVALREDAMREIEAWGKPSVMLVPSGWHRMDAPAYLERYPGLTVFCPEGARRRVERAVRVTGTYADFANDDRVKVETIAGTRAGEGALIIHGSSGTTLVLNDLVFNMPDLPGALGLLLKHVTQSSGGPRVTRVARWVHVKDRAQVRSHFERFAALPNLRRIVVSHHRVIDQDPAGTLRRLAESL
jgi:hypothetical protein